jgi:hypothetical protein
MRIAAKNGLLDRGFQHASLRASVVTSYGCGWLARWASPMDTSWRQSHARSSGIVSVLPLRLYSVEFGFFRVSCEERQDYWDAFAVVCRLEGSSAFVQAH